MKNWLILILGGYLKEDVYAASTASAALHLKEKEEAKAQGRREVTAEIYAMAEKQQPIGLVPPTGNPDDMIILTVDEFANDMDGVTVH